MSRLIDADELMEAINTWPKFGVDGRGRIVLWNEGYEPYIHLMDVVIAITGMPTIEERKTGYWECVPHKSVEHGEVVIDGDTVRCSNCRHAEKGWNAGMHYCPHCGADMRGEQDG